MADPEQLLPQDGPTRWAGVEEKLGVVGAIASLCVSMLGTGIVAFPSGFALCGYLMGPVSVLLLAYLAHLSYVSLIHCTAKEHVASYGELVQKLPRVYQHYTNVALWALLVLATTTSVLIASDIIRTILWHGSSNDVPFMLQNHVLFAVVLLVILPLCLAKSLHGVSLMSAYCTCAILTVVVLIVWRCLQVATSESLPQSSAPTAAAAAPSVVLALPLFGCAMFGHMNMSQIYAELRPDAKKYAPMVSLAACAGTLFLYLLVGGAGYAAFGRTAMPDVVAQLGLHCGETADIAVMHGLLGSFVVLKTPLLVLPLRSLTLQVLDPTLKPNELPPGRHFLLTLTLLAFVYLAAVALPDLDRLLEILGALFVVPLCFVVPARLSWTIEIPRPSLKCIALGVFGTVASLLSLVAVVIL